MAVPTSMRAGPFTPTVLARKRHLIFYILIMWISGIPIWLEFWFYWQLLINNLVYFYVFLPVFAFIVYVSAVLSSLVVAKCFLVVVNAIHKPREGKFMRDPADKDYRYWSIRNTIKRWPIWLSHKFPFPFMDNLCFKMFGVKTKFSNSLFEGWVDTEFIEIGDNVVVGQASIVQSAVIIGNHLIIQKTVIEDDVRIGAHAFVMPGTHIGKRCIVAGHTLTTMNQELEEGWIYLGVPAKKYKRNRFFEEGKEQIIKESAQVDIHELRMKLEEEFHKRYDGHTPLRERLMTWKDQKENEQRRMEETKK